jgi:hypothetical protein
MAVIDLAVDQKTVCAVPDPGIVGTSEWESGNTKVFSIEDVADDARTATVVAAASGVGWVTVTTKNETQSVIYTLEVRVAGSNVKFGDVSASTPEPKEQRETKASRE